MTRTAFASSLADNWPDAARLLAAAMLAYAIAHLLALHEAHWAVLTALVTARGHAGGTARAGVERLVATIAGAGLAVAAATARHAWHVADALILFSALAPLCLLSAVRPNYRGAPIAALIVLSSGPAAGMGALGTALLRTTEIAVGAVASVLVSASLFPARGRARARAHAAEIVRLLAKRLHALAGGAGAHAGHAEHLRDAIRGELRELTILAHTSGWRKMQDAETARLLKVVSALNIDTGFVLRALSRRPLDAAVVELEAPVEHAVLELVSAFDRCAAAVASAEPSPELGAVDDALRNLATAARSAREAVESRHSDVIVYLLRTLRTDLTLLSPPTGESPAPGETRIRDLAT